jgi:hypothetical protein
MPKFQPPPGGPLPAFKLVGGGSLTKTSLHLRPDADPGYDIQFGYLSILGETRAVVRTSFMGCLFHHSGGPDSGTGTINLINGEGVEATSGSMVRFMRFADVGGGQLELADVAEIGADSDGVRSTIRLTPANSEPLIRVDGALQLNTSFPSAPVDGTLWFTGTAFNVLGDALFQSNTGGYEFLLSSFGEGMEIAPFILSRTGTPDPGTPKQSPVFTLRGKYYLDQVGEMPFNIGLQAIPTDDLGGGKLSFQSIDLYGGVSELASIDNTGSVTAASFTSSDVNGPGFVAVSSGPGTQAGFGWQGGARFWQDIDDSESYVFLTPPLGSNLIVLQLRDTLGGFINITPGAINIQGSAPQTAVSLLPSQLVLSVSGETSFYVTNQGKLSLNDPNIPIETVNGFKILPTGFAQFTIPRLDSKPLILTAKYFDGVGSVDVNGLLIHVMENEVGPVSKLSFQFDSVEKVSISNTGAITASSFSAYTADPSQFIEIDVNSGSIGVQNGMMGLAQSAISLNASAVGLATLQLTDFTGTGGSISLSAARTGSSLGLHDETYGVHLSSSGAFTFIGQTKAISTPCLLLSIYTNTTPADGDVWYEGSVFNFRENGVTKQLGSGSAQPYDVTMSVEGAALGDEIILRIGFTRAVDFVANFVGSVGVVAVGDTSADATVFIVYKNGTEIGTITFPSNTATATFATTGGTAQSVASGDVITVKAPTVATTLRNIAITLAGTR